MPLRLERTAPLRGVLLAPFVFISPTIGRIEVEAGFDTDYASVPRCLWNIYPPDGQYTEAAVVHDALYWHQSTCEAGLPITRKQADVVFLEALRALGVGALTTTILYRAVRVGGGGAWEENALRNPLLTPPLPGLPPRPVPALPPLPHFHKRR